MAPKLDASLFYFYVNMKIISAYIAGWKILFQHKKIWLLLYLVQLIVAGMATIPFADYIEKTVGRSLDIKESMGRFDYTFFNDFLTNYGSGFEVLLMMWLGFIALYFVIGIFLTGGVLRMVEDERHHLSLSEFISGAGHFFWRLLRLSFYFLLLQGLLLAVMGFIFLQKTNYLNPFELESEVIIIKAAALLLPIYLLLAILLFMIHDLVKLHLLRQDASWLHYLIRDGFKTSIKNFFSFFPLYLLNIIFFLLWSVLYYYLNYLLSPTTLGQVFFFFFLGQVYLFIRVGMKVINLGSMNVLRGLEGGDEGTQMTRISADF